MFPEANFDPDPDPIGTAALAAEKKVTAETLPEREANVHPDPDSIGTAAMADDKKGHG